MSAFYELEFVTRTGAAMAAADDDYFYADTLLVGGSDQTITGALAQTEGAYARCVTATITDADSSVTALKVWLTGLDIQGRVIQETLTFAGAGTETVTSNYAFHALTAVVYHADGTIGGSDTLKIGFGDTLGVPVDFSAVGDLLRARMDSTAYNDLTVGAGTWNATYNTWVPPSAPNGARTYFVQVAL